MFNIEDKILEFKTKLRRKQIAKSHSVIKFNDCLLKEILPTLKYIKN